MIEPHGGTLVDLYLPHDEAALKQHEAASLVTWDLTSRQLCDLELLMCGAFSPLEGFMNKVDYDAVVESMRLADGTLWPIPIVLDVPRAFADKLHRGQEIALRDPEGVILATLTVDNAWLPDKQYEALRVYENCNREHPGVRRLYDSHETYLGGKVVGLKKPSHRSFPHLRDTPKQMRKIFQTVGWERIVGFQTRNPMHRAHDALVIQAARAAEANVLLHPVVGETMPGDIDPLTRIRCYQRTRQRMERWFTFGTTLSALPLSMRMAGPREAVWHAIIRKNYGCTHFIVGRDHAGPGKNSAGEHFYGEDEAQQLLMSLADELVIEPVCLPKMVYDEQATRYLPEDEVPSHHTTRTLSGTELRRMLSNGEPIPDWFTHPEIAAELYRSYPPRYQRGFVVFLTGLSGAGKSTIAKVLEAKLLEEGGRSVTVLDGDVVRNHLSKGLGFSREDRDENIRRIGFVASEIAKAGGIAICAAIAPYETTRQEVRAMVGERAGFVEVHVATPLELCEARDPKGLYAKARAGEIEEFTGVSAPYEHPRMPELRVYTDHAPEQATEMILRELKGLGYMAAQPR